MNWPFLVPQRTRTQMKIWNLPPPCGPHPAAKHGTLEVPLPSCTGPGQLKNLAPRWFYSWLGPRLFFSRVLSAAWSSLAAAARLSLRAWIAAQNIFSHSISDWVILMLLHLLLKGATGKEHQRLLLLRGLVSSRYPAKEPMQHYVWCVWQLQ